MYKRIIYKPIFKKDNVKILQISSSCFEGDEYVSGLGDDQMVYEWNFIYLKWISDNERVEVEAETSAELGEKVEEMKIKLNIK